MKHENENEDNEDEDDEEEEENEEEEQFSSPSKIKEKKELKEEISQNILEEIETNPKFHLLHNGKWIPKEYKVGRLVKLTGIW